MCSALSLLIGAKDHFNYIIYVIIVVIFIILYLLCSYFVSTSISLSCTTTSKSLNKQTNQPDATALVSSPSLILKLLTGSGVLVIGSMTEKAGQGGGEPVRVGDQ